MVGINKQLKRYFVIVALISAVIITLLSNVGINYFFNNYVEKNRLEDDKRIIANLNTNFSMDNLFEVDTLRKITYLARNESVEIIIEVQGEKLLDTSNMSGMGMGMGMGMGRKTQGYLENLKYNSYYLYEGKSNIIIKIGRPINVLMTEEDKNFIFTMNGIYIFAFIVTVISAIILSIYVSKKFLKPILGIKKNVDYISEEKYNKINEINNTTLELEELSKSIKNLAMKIENQESLRKRLTSDMAHEIRTPLATLQSHLEAFLDGVIELTPEKLMSCYDEIIRLTKLVNDLSDLSRIENKQMELDLKETNISVLLNNIIDNFEPMISGKKINLAKEIESNIHLICDKDRISQVFINLLSNAYKYTENGGEIAVELMKADNNIRVIIKDTGVGIAREDLPYIFERFYRGDVSRNKETGGTGIGLTISKAIVDAHGGKINILSEKGIGTQVEIILNV